MNRPEYFVGIDVAKASLDVAVRPEVRPIKDPQIQALAALITRRRQLEVSKYR